MQVHRKKIYNGEIKMYFYLAMVGFEPTPTLTAAPSNTETTVIPSRPNINIYIRGGIKKFVHLCHKFLMAYVTIPNIWHVFSQYVSSLDAKF